MQMTTETLDNGATRVNLDGQLDISGFQEIDTEFESLASSADNILVDMSNVSFLASIGIRTLVMAAKSQHVRNKTLVIVNPQEMVEQVLRTAGIDQIIPIHADETAALAEFA